MIDIAKKAGADAIKFQTFKADKIQLKNSTKPNYQKKIKHLNYYEIIKSLETNYLDQKKIFEYCNKKNILFLSTPYDEDSADFLDSLPVSAFKISSSDLTNHILLKHILKKKKLVLLSTGLSDSKLVNDAVDLFKKEKMLKNLILLHTTSDYPAKNDQINLKVIPEYIKKYDPGLIVSTLQDELKTNPYIRFNAPAMINNLQKRNLQTDTEYARFKSIMDIY